MHKGQITVFLSLMLLFLLGVTGALMEAARYSGANALTAAASGCVTDSVFSEYHRLLLEKYELFFLDGSYGQPDFLTERIGERMEEYGGYFVDPTKNTTAFHTDLWHLQMGGQKVESYALATDDGGKALRVQAAAYMKGQLGTEAVTHLRDFLDSGFDEQALEADLDAREKQSEQELEEARQEQQAINQQTEQETGGVSPGTVTTEEQEKWRANNPIMIIREWKEKGVLGLVMTKELSGCEVNASLLPSNREILAGTMTSAEYGAEESAGGIRAQTEKLLCNEYFLKKFSNAGSAPEGENPFDGRLVYQIEYLLEGKGRDTDNLKAVVHKLLLIREALNFGYLLTDGVKQAQAETAAWAIAGATAIVPLVKAVKYGILLAWAYGESLLDVRMMLSGEKVAAVKTAQNWKLSLEQIAELATLQTGEQETEAGALSYQDYLRILLFAEKDETVTMRAWDLIEMDMQHTRGQECFMADHLVTAAKLSYSYEMPVLFDWGFLGAVFPDRHTYSWTVPFSYLND